MAAPKENSLFPPHPYYIPGYEGFIPQYNSQFGETFGKTTYRLLTDPGVRRSPRPLLAPLHKQKFIEDFSGTKHGVQGYLPGRPGYFPYGKSGAATSSPEPLLGPKPPPPGPAEEELMMMHMDPVPQDHPGEYVPTTRLPQEYPRSISSHPASEGREWRLPELTPGPSQLGGALAGSKPPVKIEGVTLPGVAETADVEQDNRLPKLDIPNAIQQKVIPVYSAKVLYLSQPLPLPDQLILIQYVCSLLSSSEGYAGFIPRLTWIHGMNYVQGVKEAMNEFERHQFLQRNPVGSFGKRFPQRYWPNHRIYTSAGLIPSYTGFVPDLRPTYALTFGNSTRKAYQKEQRRRACAL
ncbi:ciliary microtubule inner protein 2A [Pluvialis apricaria]